LEYAVQTNPQIYNAVADKGPFPDLVKELVAEREPAGLNEQSF
jgi:hypothetical protein